MQFRYGKRVQLSNQIGGDKMTNAMCSHCKCEIQEGQEKFLHHKVLCPTCDKNMKARHDGSFKIYRQGGLYGKAGKLPNAVLS